MPSTKIGGKAMKKPRRESFESFDPKLSLATWFVAEALNLFTCQELQAPIDF